MEAHIFNTEIYQITSPSCCFFTQTLVVMRKQELRKVQKSED